jgi:hypothetical protein
VYQVLTDCTPGDTASRHHYITIKICYCFCHFITGTHSRVFLSFPVICGSKNSLDPRIPQQSQLCKLRAITSVRRLGDFPRRCCHLPRNRKTFLRPYPYFYALVILRMIHFHGLPKKKKFLRKTRDSRCKVRA